MKLLLVLLALTSCSGPSIKMKGDFFVPMGTGIHCRLITHNYELKDCYTSNGYLTSDLYNAVNIRKVTF